MIHIKGSAKTTLTNIQKDDIQPNAIDLRVQKIFKIKDTIFTIDEEKKVHRGSDELPLDDDGYWTLEPGCYEIVMANIIDVADNEDGWVITRSTLNRNGVFITSGLYDAGYNGVMAAAIHVSVGPMRIKPDTRVGQYLCFSAETLHKYNGDYGLNKDHDTKY